MFHTLKTIKILWTITTCLALAAAIVGIFLPHIYDSVFAPEFIPGALPQDILTAMLCLFTFYLIAKTKPASVRLQILITGIMGSFFYLYGIFTIERVYNAAYLLYAAIFAASFWTLVYSLMQLNKQISVKPFRLAYLSAIVGLIIAILFTFLWVSALIPLMQAHHRIDYLYSIYILDLCFIMPAFFITSILTLKKHSFGLLLLPTVFIVGFFVIFPLGLNELAKPFYGQITNYGSMMMSFGFAILMLILATLQLIKLQPHTT